MPISSLILDLDRTISDSRWRESLLRRSKPQNFDAFHEHAGADPCIEELCDLVIALQKQRVDILVLTSRPISVETQTLAWLQAQGIRPSLVLMREDDDDSSPEDLKRRQLAYARSLGYDPAFAIDDDKEVCAMFQKEGLVVLRPHLPVAIPEEELA